MGGNKHNNASHPETVKVGSRPRLWWLWLPVGVAIKPSPSRSRVGTSERVKLLSYDRMTSRFLCEWLNAQQPNAADH